jgi:hypothetical protein
MRMRRALLSVHGIGVSVTYTFRGNAVSSIQRTSNVTFNPFGHCCICRFKPPGINAGGTDWSCVFLNDIELIYGSAAIGAQPPFVVATWKYLKFRYPGYEIPSSAGADVFILIHY